MWKIIGIPLVIYLFFVLYIYVPVPQKEAPIAELIKQLPVDKVQLYIHNNAAFAIVEMKRAKVPASITLAQAILESTYGTSELAQKANNHFGIKADTDWNFPNRHCIHSNEWNTQNNTAAPMLSCFRKYDNIQDSYSNHSDFLCKRPYYANLFKLDIMDYKSWANGLQKAGYATDPLYAKKLIAIIDRYKLQHYDLFLEQHPDGEFTS